MNASCFEVDFGYRNDSIVYRVWFENRWISEKGAAQKIFVILVGDSDRHCKTYMEFSNVQQNLSHLYSCERGVLETGC